MSGQPVLFTDTDSESTASSVPSELKIRKLPVGIILLVELCERLTYYTLAGTQKTYLQNQLDKAPSSSAALNSVFSMLCYFWCIPGGLVADSIGRYKTIIMAGSVYAVGTVCVGLAVVHDLQQSLGWLFMFGSLVLIAAGTGGIKPNIANFGADQIGDLTERQRECQKTFFSLFYLSINVGVLVAFGFLTNITTAGLPGVVSQAEGYSFAYGSGAASMILAVILFVAFTSSYKREAGSGLGPVKALVKYQMHSVLNGGGWRAIMSLLGFLCLPCFFLCTLASTLLASPSHSASSEVFVDPCASQLAPASAPPRMLHGGGGGSALLDNAALGLGSCACIFLVVANMSCTWVRELNEEKASFTSNDAKQFFAAIPMIIVVNIAFNLCYNSMNNAFPSQACQMDLRLGNTQLNGAFFNIADAFAIIIFTPLFETCLYPMIAKIKGSPVRLGQKIIAGLLIAAASNVSAALLEDKRKAAPYLCGPDIGFSQCAPGYSEDGLEGTRMKDISAFYIFLPFTLVGIAEILVNPCMYCFSYEAAPMELRSLLQAVNLFFSGSVSNAFTAVVAKMAYPNSLDDGNLNKYYYINVVISILGIGVYFIVTRCNHGREMKKVVKTEIMEACGAESDGEL
ncbi:unnamed protein product [Effrenium voratum]|uniref:Uncharacterized protein n=1 Tax=Effrenium voratum TaxID=2562239 RepID=A0AA36IYT6_9DINO|nr:unnamed protein product [Effrenium voratum]